MLRGLLAAYVLAGHARWLLWTGQGKWAAKSHSVWQNVLATSSGLPRYGHEAVMVFLVLSGFFIHLRAAQQQAGMPASAVLSHLALHRSPSVASSSSSASSTGPVEALDHSA